MKIINCPCGHEYATKKDKPQCGKCGKRTKSITKSQEKKEV